MEIKLSGHWKEDEIGDVIAKCKEAINYFPEIPIEHLNIYRLPDTDHALGRAFYNVEQSRVKIGLQPNPSMHTIGHELMHHVQSHRLITLPTSEIACDVWTTAKSEIFNDAPCHYVRHAPEIFNYCKRAHRDFMIMGVMLYKELGKRKWAIELQKRMDVFKESHILN